MHTRGVSALPLEVNKQTENLVGGISVYFSTQRGLKKYNFSRCYCKIVLCWYVDSLECGLRNYAKKLIFEEFVR